MFKNALYILLFLMCGLPLKGNCQVPLFIEVEDSITVKSDTSNTHNEVAKSNPALKKQAKKGDNLKGNSRYNTKIDSLIMFAEQYLGNRYRRGGTSTTGFDCSGFTMTVFKHLGIKLPHTSAGQGLVGVNVSQQNIQKGDLILFRGGNRRSARIGHVGIVISEKGEPVKFIHSSTSSGVRVDNLASPYYRLRYVKSVRISDLYL